MGNELLRKKFADLEPEYDSDQDLLPAERQQVRYANNPDAMRDKLWEEKPISDKFSKTLKTIWYGDKVKKYNE
jgi:hypothetical protein